MSYTYQAFKENIEFLSNIEPYDKLCLEIGLMDLDALIKNHSTNHISLNGKNFQYYLQVAYFLMNNAKKIKENDEEYIMAELEKHLIEKCDDYDTCFNSILKETLISLFCLIRYLIKDKNIESEKDELHNNTIKENMWQSLRQFTAFFSEHKESLYNLSLDVINGKIDPINHFIPTDGLLYSEENCIFTLMFLIKNIDFNFDHSDHVINEFMYNSHGMKYRDYTGKFNFPKNIFSYEDQLYGAKIITHVIRNVITSFKPFIKCEETNTKTEQTEEDELNYKKSIIEGLALATITNRLSEDNSYTKDMSKDLIKYYLDFCKKEKILLTTAWVDIPNLCFTSAPVLGNNHKQLTLYVPIDGNLCPDCLKNRIIRKAYIVNSN